MKKVVAHPNAQASARSQLNDDTAKHTEATIVELALKADNHPETPSIQEVVSQNIKTYFDQLGDQDAHDLYQMVLNQVEPALLDQVLNHTRGNQSKAATLLGLNRGTLRKKLKQHGLDS